MYAARGKPAHLTERQYQRTMISGAYLREHMGDAPVILLPCLRRPVVPPPDSLPPEMRARHDAEVAYTSRIRGASIYPAVQNIMLACRGLGLGITITTNHIRCEDEVRALLRLPVDVDTFAIWNEPPIPRFAGRHLPRYTAGRNDLQKNDPAWRGTKEFPLPLLRDLRPSA